MATNTRRRIDPALWAEFCETFTRLHRGWKVTVGTLSTPLLETAEEVSAHRVANEIAFRGLSVDNEPAGAALVILLGEDGNHYTHEVTHLAALYLETLEDGSHKGIRVDDEGGHTLLMHFRAPVRSEELDGLAAQER